MIWFWFLVSVFVCYRLARLFCIDELPFGIGTRLRQKAIEKSKKQYDLWWTIAELFHCLHCAGFWIGLGLGIALFGWQYGLLIGLAIAGAQSCLWQWGNNDSDD